MKLREHVKKYWPPRWKSFFGATTQISGDDEVFAVLAGFTLTTFSLWTLLGG